MPVYFVREGDRGVAYFRANDQAEDVFVAAIALVTYDSNSDVRDHFAALVAAAADCYRRTCAAAAVTPSAWVDELPCSKCDSPLAADVMHRARQASDVSELELSPGGFPAGCCKRRIVGAFGGRPDALQSVARR
jgi:hypothetical protein